jgi:hypothetical protein
VFNAAVGVLLTAISTCNRLGWGSGSFLLTGASHQNSPPSFQIESQLQKSAHNAVAKESKGKNMKRKHLFLAIATLLAAGGWWLARPAWRTHAFHKSSMSVGFKTPRGTNFDPNSASLPRASQAGASPNPTNRPKPGQMLRPPVPNRRFTDFTPEQRVEFARKGHGPGG